ncbi:MAG: TIM barrel protein [Clostridia bacterium]|nr:TIM barrel protein [Clostridia bacterium]
MIKCIHACAENNVPIMVSHAFIGFDVPPIPVEKGLQRYYELITEARKYGVTIAFENTEGEEYLDALLKNFGDLENVGFCWDSGHEMCYNRGADLLKKYGKLLVCTHINDNLGIKDTGGKTTWRDDLHLLPFDGIIDWEYNARRLVRENYVGTLTFELKIASKPGRHENDIYALMSPESYLAEIYKRACRFEALVYRAKGRLEA